MIDEKDVKVNEEHHVLDALHLRIANALGVKGMSVEKLKRNMMENEENNSVCQQIVNPKTRIDFFMVVQTGPEACQIRTELQELQNFKKKVIVFFNFSFEPLSVYNLNKLIFFEINKMPLQLLHKLFSEVYLPILTNPRNQKNWNEMLSRDLMERINAFLAQIYLVIGKIEGKTLLPLPLEKSIFSRDIPDKEKCQIFESRIITWTKQIKKVLDTEPEHILKENPHPDPIVELNFWKKKAENLNSINEQLQLEQVLYIVDFLRVAKSTFINQFDRLQTEITEARREANENYMYLSTLEDYFLKLMDTSYDFMKLPDLFLPLMHSLLLIYNNSNYYCAPSRMVLLIREICNAIIKRALDYIPGETVVALMQNRDDIETACDKLQITIDVCTKFKDTYFEYKAKSHGKWKFPPNALFMNLDNFLERCYDILHVTSTIQQFNKLENCKLGGTKGKYLTESTKAVYNEFLMASKTFGHIEYDIMDTNCKKFEADFFVFRNKTKELERRLASIITQSFDDLDTLMDKFKLLDSFEILLRRPIIQGELERKHIVLLEAYKNDLKVVQSTFLENKTLVDKNDAQASIFNNLPPVSGALTWAQSLETRITEPYNKLLKLDSDLIEKEEFKDVEKLYDSISKMLRDYKESKILTWEKDIQASSEEKLRQFLLVREEPDKTLKVNFDPSIVRLLKEVKYLYQLNINIPDNAAEIYANDELYRTQINKLDNIVYMYNFIITTLNSVEEPLVIDRIKQIDKILEPGLTELKWKSPGINEFITRVFNVVDDVFKIVNKMKFDLEKIKEALKEFDKPAVERKAKSVLPEEFFTAHQASITQSHQKIAHVSNAIGKMIKETNDVVKVKKGTTAWREYQEYINEIIIDGLAKAICTSLTTLEGFVDMDRKRSDDYVPWFEIGIQLVKNKICFSPEFSEILGPLTIKSIINTVVKDVIDIAIHMKRVETGGVGDYLVEIKDDFNVRFRLANIYKDLDMIEGELRTYYHGYDEFNAYISKDPVESFNAFLESNVVKKVTNVDGDDDHLDEEIESKNPLMKNVVTKLRNFKLFDQNITELKLVRSKIELIKSTVEIGWLKIRVDPLKKALGDKLNEWIYVYVNFLNTQIKTIITNCKSFEHYLLDGIHSTPQDHPEDKNMLMKVMEVLSTHRLVNSQLDKNFSFVKELINLLKVHIEPKFYNDKDNNGFEYNIDDYQAVVEEVQTKFSEIFQQVIQVKTNILGLQQKETESLKKEIQVFSQKVQRFRQDFLENAPFRFNLDTTVPEVHHAYQIIEDFRTKVREIKAEAAKYNDLENLFELERTKYKSLNDCTLDLDKLEVMWQMIEKILTTYDKWRRILWKNIKVDELSPENEKYVQMLKQAPREVKNFKSYAFIVEKVNNMKKTLNCIDMLGSEAMQDRHWNTISNELCETIDYKSSAFCFDDILKLDVFKYEVIVQETTENANKELKIGKDLDKINSVWSKLTFEFEVFNQAGGELKIFKPFDTIQEILDNDTSKLLSLLSQGKSVEVFRDNLNNIKHKLNQVDTVLNLWNKVQKNWKRLVNIFLLSEDIRNQLQDATKLFDQKNNQFREIMMEVALNPKIIEVCTEERRVELEEIHKSIEECEKKLNMYLEQKKKAFARFYFVSNQTLIDILSNGNNPTKIATEYLGDLFDGVKMLKLKDNPDNKTGVPQGIAMVSKDDEVVPFRTPFEPKDEVEIWLSNLEYKMRESMQLILEESKHTADEYFNSADIKEEHKMDWILNYNAQVALVTVQITWTDDVHKSFDDMEGGMSNAMKDCFEGIKRRINLLISKVRNPSLSKEIRNKIITIITIDVHSRDVVEKLLEKNINDKESFQWYSQLKFYWSKESNDVTLNQRARFPWEKSIDKPKAVIRIIDWSKFYTYEYVGNCGRLVITPLTDRCYITLTQALSLNMGGAPAGPAGTGKTETTKDLGRACGLPVFVFNCSEQMNTDSLGQIFMGLSQTGAWGCFDEFNRISIEVLSVVSTQVKQVLEALKEKRERFIFMDDEISLQDTVGFFITMNPGYAGRTELPENLKALFRSCAMIVPDLMLICENMLMSEGYNEARELAKKFVTLYSLSKSLLSKQKHYDWGLRAVKSVLRQAGKLKRNNEDKNENLLLFGALKDFNIPKIVTDDKPIFINLLKDLFTEVSGVPETIIDEDLKTIVAKKVKELNLVAEEQFCLKCVQLSDILEVRHCVFIIGPPGCGKSAVWKTLAAANKEIDLETEYDCLDPKAVTADELFGTLSKTKEFKNGVLSSIIKMQCKEQGKYKSTHKMKWAVLDGDIDPEWIESLNTVMDDNKVLTLVSNDRFPLTPSMRLLFEISNLKHATPATVSRAGVLYINDTDIGWKPYFESWLDSHRADILTKAYNAGKIIRKVPFDQLAVSVFLKCQQYFENPEIMRLIHVIPTVDIMLVEATTTIIDGLLYKYKHLLENRKEEELRTIYEGIFLYAAMWGIGGSFLESGEDEPYYKEFARLWKLQAKIKYPEIKITEGKNLSIFDFNFDLQTLSWVPCDVPKFDAGEDLNFTKLFVPTMYTQRLWDLMELHVSQNRPFMFVGNAGTGKTALITQYINTLKNDSYTKNAVNFSSMTSSASLQDSLMTSGLSKLGMRLWGLGAARTLVFFIDDINMPHVDKYGTQSPIALIRQIHDYGIVYDRENLEEYNRLQDLYFCACLNPKAGSFTIEPRLQRHFSVFCLPVPNDLVIKQIYKSILNVHFADFGTAFNEMPTRIVDATVSLYMSLIRDTSFNPSAKKFHYQFNLRELSKVTEGVMFSDVAHYKGDPAKIAKLWVHECRRVFQDRLVFKEDIDKFTEYLKRAFNLLTDGSIKLTDAEKNDIMSDTNIFTTFIPTFEGENETIYLPVASMDRLKKVLEVKKAEYNENKAQMNLVLFKDAMMHIARISRILDRTNGHALLIGVGGSGKQSLTKLAAFIQGYELELLPSGSSINMMDFKQFLGDMIKKATKPPGTQRIFMITDTQIKSDEMIVYINDMLNNGYIPGLWPRDELDSHLQTMKTEARQANYPDTPEALQAYFVDKIKRNVHIVLCMSPVGDALRIRARKFPGLINSTMINWFHSWPKDALYDVAYNFLKEIDFPVEGVAEKIAHNMSEAHQQIDQINQEFLQQERRYNYTTPKSYLELIEFYKSQLTKGRNEIETSIDNLIKGLTTLSETQSKVKEIEENLKEVMIDVEQKKAETNKLIEKVNVQKKDANEQQIMANEEERKTLELAAAANGIKEKAEMAYLDAKPKLEKAQEALSRLSADKVTIMKNLKSPPPLVMLTGKVVSYVFKGEKVDIFSDKDNDVAWKRACNIMNNVKRFLQDLAYFSNETAKSLDTTIKENVKKLIQSGKFNVDNVMEVSSAAGNLADWVHNIIDFNEAYNIVKPLEEEKNEAEELVRAKNKELEVVKEKVRVLNDKLSNLEKQLNEAEEQERKVETERTHFQRKLDAAQKLVSGLSSEYTRWIQNVEVLKTKRLTVIGDTLLAAEFVSYIAPFTANYRLKLWRDLWIPDIKARNIPITNDITPLEILTNNAEIAKWKNQGLPEDEMSLQNATIVMSSKRWPLIIDPQLQGTTWLQGHYQEAQAKEENNKRFDDDEENAGSPNELLRFSFNTKNWLQKLKMAITYGKKVLIENVTENLDSNIEPLLGQEIIKKGNSMFIKMGTDQIDYNRDFRMYLQCKRQNPHFRPEIAAQCTIINFIVTERGLEDQLLAMVVNYERQELENRKQTLVRQQNDFEVKLRELEETLLTSLSHANPENILDDTELIENLDNMKKTATSIEIQKAEGKETEKIINEEREKYRVVASEGATLYFLIISLSVVDHMYQYSLDSFITFFFKAMYATDSQTDERVNELVLNIRFTIYQWISRGLFEKHKIIFLTMLSFRMLQKGIIKTDWNQKMMNYLLNAVPKTDVENPLKDWLPNSAWFSVQRLAEIEEFSKLPDAIEKELPARFKDWFNEISPENTRLPSEWRKLDSQPFFKLCVIRALRPDKMSAALTNFIKMVLPKGHEFVSMDQNLTFNQILDSAIKDATQENTMNSPVFFILSAGADPVKEVERLGKQYKFEYNLNNFFDIALGQGQDRYAESKLDAGFRDGYWVMLQNIHLMPSWLPTLEKKLDQFMKEDGCHPNFRLFLSAEPNKDIPVGILERCIKLTNEPPAGLKANMKRAWSYFPKDDIDEKDTKYNHILFALCYFHSVLIERRKFGAMGWNMFYPFNIGDLRDSYAVLCKNAETNTSGKIPWADLKYIFGEIMYGGHIVDDWDRRLCNSYLEYILQPNLCTEEFELLPFVEGKKYSLKVPPVNSKFQRYYDHIENEIQDETPIAYGLHPNAEIGLGTNQCNYIFSTLLDLLPKDSADKKEENLPVNRNADAYFNKIFFDYNLKEKIFNILDIKDKIVETGPFQNVFLQECEYMNTLLEEITRSMFELDQGLKGILTMTEKMENLLDALNYERIPENWLRLAYPSKRFLSSWLDNLVKRINQLVAWKDDPMNIPKVTRLNKLFNPQSFLTAIKQYSKKGDLNKLMIATEFTKKSIEEIEQQAPKDGAYCYGFLLEGARWDWSIGQIEESKPKEMFSVMPVVLCKAVPVPKTTREDKTTYECPVYRTVSRGDTYIFNAQLKTSNKNPPRKWILGGVAIILDVEGVSDDIKKESK